MIIGWFSGGVTSTVAIKLAIEAGFDVDVYYFETGQHHEDHDRFRRDCEKWFGRSIHVLRNKKFSDPIDVIRKSKYVNGPGGARCTLELKKEVRFQLEKIVDFKHQIFGFESDKKQINRAIRFQEQYPEAHAVFPLIELGYSKEDCMKSVSEAGIELPAMYKLGYNNSNCIGCVKGGMGYWNKIRNDFPDIFEETARVEREVGRSCIKGQFLDELDPERGRHDDISLPECGVVCPVELDGLREITNTNFLTNRLFDL